MSKLSVQNSHSFDEKEYSRIIQKILFQAFFWKKKKKQNNFNEIKMRHPVCILFFIIIFTDPNNFRQSLY